MAPRLSVLPGRDSELPGAALEGMLGAARLQSDLGRQNASRTLLKAALTRHGPDPGLERLRALVELRDGRPAAALAAIARIGGPATDITTLRVQAAALCQTGKPEEALAPAQAAVARQRDVATVTLLGMVELVTGREAAALEAAVEAVRRFPAAPAAHRLACLVALRQQRWEAAEQAARAASHCPGGEGPEALNNLALALLAQGRLPEARGIMRSAWVASEVTEHAAVVRANHRQLESGRGGAGGGLRAALGSGSSPVLVVLLGVVVVGLALRQFALPTLGLALVIGLWLQRRRGSAPRRPLRALPAWSAVTVRAPRRD